MQDQKNCNKACFAQRGCRGLTGGVINSLFSHNCMCNSWIGGPRNAKKECCAQRSCQELTGGVAGVAEWDAGPLNAFACASIIYVRRYLVVHSRAQLGILHRRRHNAGQYLHFMLDSDSLSCHLQGLMLGICFVYVMFSLRFTLHMCMHLGDSLGDKSTT